MHFRQHLVDSNFDRNGFRSRVHMEEEEEEEEVEEEEEEETINERDTFDTLNNVDR